MDFQLNVDKRQARIQGARNPVKFAKKKENRREKGRRIEEGRRKRREKKGKRREKT